MRGNTTFSSRAHRILGRPGALVGSAGGLLMVAGLLLAACAGVPAKRPYTQMTPARPRLVAGSVPPNAKAGAPSTLDPAGAEPLDVRAMLDGLENAPWKSATAGAAVAQNQGGADRQAPTATAPVTLAENPPPSPPPAAPEPIAEPESTPAAPVPSTSFPAADAPPIVPSAGDETARLVAEAGASEPLRAAIRLAALENLRPGIAAKELEAARKRLTPGEIESLDAVTDLLRDVAGSGAGTSDVAAAIERHARRLESSRPLTISRAVLCTRVEAFGRYTPLPSSTFVRGRPHAAILYVALENFSQRADLAAQPRSAATPPRAKGGLRDTLVKLLEVGGGASGDAKRADDEQTGNWVTEVAQSVSLYHDSDNLEVWRAPEQSVRDVSRHRRRDHFLVRRIDLPANLSVGRYNLKVTLRDTGGAGAGGSIAEAILPLVIVADPALANAR